MSDTKIPPSLEKVKMTAQRAKLACLEMRQAGEELEKAIIELEAQVSASSEVQAKSKDQ